MALTDISEFLTKVSEDELIPIIVKLKYAKYVEEDGKRILLCKVCGKAAKEVTIVISNESFGGEPGKSWRTIEKLKSGCTIKCNADIIPIPNATYVITFKEII